MSYNEEKVYDQREDLYRVQQEELRRQQNTQKVCSCENVEFGSYTNQVEIRLDFWPLMLAYKRLQGGADSVCVDRCLVEEMQTLWDCGIVTTGCCCGHNKAEGFIGVIEGHIPRMLEMGYKVHYNQCRPGDFDSFIPKSLNYPTNEQSKDLHDRIHPR